MNTDYKHIDNILNKYFEGLTTLSEEKVLRNYFSSDDIAETHRPYKAMFQHFEQAQRMTNPKPFQIQNKTRNYRVYYAASIVLFIGLGLVWLLQQDYKKNNYFNNVSTQVQISNNNPQKKEEAKKEIKKFTKNIRKGIENAGTLSLFGTSTKKVFNIKNNKK